MTDNNRLTEVSTDTFHASELGLVIKGTPTIEEWVAYGEKLRRVETSMNWIIGDYLVYGDFKYGEKYAQALDESMIRSWKVYHWVSKHVTPERRREELTWTHHRLVANLPAEYQTKLLQMSIDEGLDTPHLDMMLRKVADNVFDTITRAENDDNNQERSSYGYGKQLRQFLSDAIEAGVPVEMTPEIYTMYIRMSGKGRCPHCQGIILLSDFFATKHYGKEFHIKPSVAAGSVFTPVDDD